MMEHRAIRPRSASGKRLAAATHPRLDAKHYDRKVDFGVRNGVLGIRLDVRGGTPSRNDSNEFGDGISLTGVGGLQSRSTATR